MGMVEMRLSFWRRDSVSAALRHRAFSIYAALEPFAMPAREALRCIVDASLAREHRWSGADCALAARSGNDPSALSSKP